MISEFELEDALLNNYKRFENCDLARMVLDKGQRAEYNEAEIQLIRSLLPEEKWFDTDGKMLMRLVFDAVLWKIKGKGPFRGYPCKHFEILHFAPLRDMISEEVHDIFRVALLDLVGEIHYVYIVADRILPIDGILKNCASIFRLRGISNPVSKRFPEENWFNSDDSWYSWVTSRTASTR